VKELLLSVVIMAGFGMAQQALVRLPLDTIASQRVVILR
jgi:hypothetical protein